MRRNEILDEWVKVFRENFDIELVRKQTSPKRRYYKGNQVFQMFLTPVHPKKKYVDKVLAAVAIEFTSVEQRKKKTRVMSKRDVETSFPT